MLSFGGFLNDENHSSPPSNECAHSLFQIKVCCVETSDKPETAVYVGSE